MQIHILVPESAMVAYTTCTGTGAYIAIAAAHIGFLQKL